MPLKALSQYSGVSVRALRAYLKHPDHPLPCYRPGGKVLVKKSDFDAWLARFREAGASDVDAIVNDTLRELRAGS
jgi:excisionase family DNA binding protein